MNPVHTSHWRVLALFLTLTALAPALAACGSSSNTSSPSSASAPTEKPAATTSAEAEPEEAGGSGDELEGIMRLKIYGKYGGSPDEFDLAGGSCRIVKINTTPAEVKAGGAAVLDHEGSASVLVKAKGGNGGTPTTKECREAVEYAIG